jgi:hypothetical protein
VGIFFRGPPGGWGKRLSLVDYSAEIINLSSSVISETKTVSKFLLFFAKKIDFHLSLHCLLAEAMTTLAAKKIASRSDT